MLHASMPSHAGCEAARAALGKRSGAELLVLHDAAKATLAAATSEEWSEIAAAVVATIAALGLAASRASAADQLARDKRRDARALELLQGGMAPELIGAAVEREGL